MRFFIIISNEIMSNSHVFMKALEKEMIGLYILYIVIVTINLKGNMRFRSCFSTLFTQKIFYTNYIPVNRIEQNIKACAYIIRISQFRLLPK